MAVKAGYLALIGAGAVVAYSGIKGKGIGSAFRNTIAGQSPATATGANRISGNPRGSYSNPIDYGSPGLQGNVTPRQVYKAFRANGIPMWPSIMLTAITGVESQYNTRARNINVATGDYSVGITQINYYGTLLGPRTRLIGLGPEQLRNAGLNEQAHATAILWRQSGLQPWMPDITSGKVGQFMGRARAAAGL